MGLGWSSNLGNSVQLEEVTPGDRKRVWFYGPSGYRVEFRDDDRDGDYDRQEPGIDADLSFDFETGTSGVSGRFVLEMFDESKYRFDERPDTNQYSRLASQEDAAGNEITYAYKSGDPRKLDTVTDTRGRTVVFGYTNGLIESIETRAPQADGGGVLMRHKYGYELTGPGDSLAVMSFSYLDYVNPALVGTFDDTDGSESVDAVTVYEYEDTAPFRLKRVWDAREWGNYAAAGGNPNRTNTQGGTTEFTYPSTTKQKYARVGELIRRIGTEAQLGDPAGQGAAPAQGDAITGFDYDDSPVITGGTVCDDNDIQGDPNKTAAGRITISGEQVGVDDDTRHCRDAMGRIVRTVDAQGKERSNTWSDNSNVLSADMSGTGAGPSSTYTYDSEDENPESATSAEGAQSNTAFDDQNRAHSPTSISSDDTGGDAQSPLWTYAYDAENNLIKATSRTGPDSDVVEYRYCYETTGQIKRIDAPTESGAHSTNPTPGGACNVTESSGGANDTTFDYNTREELTTVVRPQDETQSFTYDALSRIATATDNRTRGGTIAGVTTAYTYDGMDRVTSTTYDNGTPNDTNDDQMVAWSYDEVGNLTQIDDGNGTNTFGYDDANRKTTESGQGPSSGFEFTYDPVGNMLSTTESQGPGGAVEYVTDYFYDNLNRVSSMLDPRRDRRVTFDYDNKDNRTWTRFPVGAATMDTNSDGVDDANPDDVVQRSAFNQDNDTICVYSYRPSSGFTAPSVASDNCPTDASADGLITYAKYDYDYDPDGFEGQGPSYKTSQKYRMTELGGNVTAYGYDELRRLTKAETRVGGVNGATIRDFDYTYDRHSNLTNERVSADSETGKTPGLETGNLWSVHTNADEICAAVHRDPGAGNTDPDLGCDGTMQGGGTLPGTVTYDHDAAGNLTTASSGGDTGLLSGAGFTYNDPSQTTSITPPGGTARTQAYDGVMQDRRTQDSETTMSYGYAGLTAQQTGTVGTAGHAELFVRDPAGTLITMLDNTTGTPSSIGQATYYLLDDQGSVIATIADTEPSSTQPVGVTRHLYEPYGQTIRDWTQPDPGNGDSGSENPNLTAPATDYNPFGYIAGYTDPDTGLIKFGTRYYIPQLGTWTQPDSEQGSSGTPPSLNLFAYSRGNPGNLTDPSGRFPGEDFLAIDSVGDAFLVAGVNLGVQALISAPLSLGCTGGIAVATGLAGTIAGAVGCAALTATVSGFIKGQIYEEVGYEY